MLAWLAWSTFGRSEAPRRVVVANADPGLVEAVGHALSPWGLEVVSVGALGFDPNVSQAAKAAHAMSQATKAGAVVWIGPRSDSGGDALWVYDSSSEQIVVRPLPTPPPFDSPTAAAVALSIKTVLRSSTMAPLLERAPSEEAPPPEPPKSRLELDFAVGASMLLAGPARAEPRVDAGLAYWLPADRLHVGVGLDVSVGSGVPINESSFTGSLSDLAPAAKARLRIGLSSWLFVEPAVGVSLHVTSLSGTLPSDASVQETRVNPAIDVAASVDARLGERIDLGLTPLATTFLRTQRYLVEGQPVFTLPLLEPSLWLRLAIALD